MKAAVKPRVPRYWWPFWMMLLATGLVAFYVVLTPVWMVIRLAARVSDKAALRRGR
jgi:hypothetical protein